MTARERAIQLVRHWSKDGYDPYFDSDILIEGVEANLLAHAESVREEDGKIADSHICGCGDHATEVGRKIRDVKVS